MEVKILKRLAEPGFFKEPLLRHFFLISLVISIALPLYYHLFIHPSFDELLTKDKKEDAASIAKHLAASIKLEEGELMKASLPVGPLEEAVRQGNEFGLLTKLKVYSKTGEVMFSTEPREVGEIHKRAHFQEVMAKGRVYTRVVQEGMKSLEGKIERLDVVETYVPLMKDGEFMGAFEIYYDISERKAQLHNLLLRSFGLLVGLAVCFMAVIIAALYKGNQNILERRRAEKALQDARDTLERNRLERQMVRAHRLASLGQLSGGIAHEIRNPLSGIGLFVDVLCDEEKFTRSASELEIFAEIKNNIGKINDIIRRILDFAKDADAALVEIKVNDLIKEVLKFWNAKMRNKEIKLELMLGENLPVVSGDMIGLQQVMNNLIQNAVEAMSDGGILTISTGNGMSSFYKNHPAVKIEVRDTGQGISPEEQAMIFNPFYTTKPTGTGLGLAISHRIVDRQGGVLSFESEPGGGATFTVELRATSRN